MTDLPIIFSGAMVRALLDGRKVQTRRVLGTRGHANIFAAGEWTDSYVMDPGNASWRERDTPYAVGDRLWVRETWASDVRNSTLPPRSILQTEPVFYAADDGSFQATQYSVRDSRSRPSIFMPRWASRLTLIVTDVRVQRLQEISEEDAVAEGAPDFGAFCEASDPGARNLAGETAAETASRLRWPQRWYSALWDHLHGPDAWAADPWVAAISFDCHRANIDALAQAATLDSAGAAHG